MRQFYYHYDSTQDAYGYHMSTASAYYGGYNAIALGTTGDAVGSIVYLHSALGIPVQCIVG